MLFAFDGKVALELVCKLLQKFENHSTSYLKLNILLYFLEREYFLQHKNVITGDTFFKTNYGPVLLSVAGLTNGLPRLQLCGTTSWDSSIKYDSTNVSLLSMPEEGELCRAMEIMLDEIFKNYGDADVNTLQDIASSFPELLGRKVSIVRHEEMMRANGRTEEEIDILSKDADHHYWVKLKLGVS